MSLLAAPAWGVSPADLLEAGRLEISAELRPADNIVPGQGVELLVSIATDRWFTSGTRLEIPEVPGLVILQTNDFASNASENRSGQSWVIQRWSLEVYPQRSGTFTVPPISTRVSVNDSSDGIVSGVLLTPSVQFEANVPTALARVDHWVAAPVFNVSQRFDRELDNLAVGDAFEREIVFKAEGVMAMMLPTFDAEEIQGLAAYAQPSALNNNSNRGTTLATRVEHITYIVEEQGQYQLPALDYYWWDTTRGELQLRFLEAVDIVVGKGTAGKTSAASERPWINVSRAELLIYSAALALVMAIGWLLYTRLPTFPWKRITAPIKHTWHQLNQMRKPALPARLNPDNNAGK